MNRIKYRACLIIVLVIAVAFGILYYVYGGEEEQEPFAGGTLVEVDAIRTDEKGLSDAAQADEKDLSDAFQADEENQPDAIQAVVRLDTPLQEQIKEEPRIRL